MIKLTDKKNNDNQDVQIFFFYFFLKQEGKYNNFFKYINIINLIFIIKYVFKSFFKNINNMIYCCGEY